MPKEWTAIDLFCGAGGLSHGFAQAGFSVIAGNDFNEVAGETYLNSHHGAKFIGGPVQSVSVNQLLRAGKLKAGQLDCLVGGPPCQGFSVYNHQRGLHDQRSGLFQEYLRLVEGLQPKWVVMENVTGMTSTGKVVQEIISGLSKFGYAVDTQILKAEEYGVPQERRRLIFLGNRIGKPIFWPKQTHGQGLKPFNTIKDAISDLPALKNGQISEEATYRTRPRGDYQKIMREGSRIAYNHAAPSLAPINLERMKYIPPGGSWRDIPFELLPRGMKKARRCDHTKRYGRLKWDGLSSTILTKCDVHWGAYIHPEQDRALSVREAARIQSFPDTFRFYGSRTDQYVQIGNAVPPLLGKLIAQAIYDSTHSTKSVRVTRSVNAAGQYTFPFG